MSKNEYLSIRIESKLKEDFYIFCEKSGISVSAAINQLIIKSIEKNSIPFTIKVVNYNKKDENTKRISIRIKLELRRGFSELCSKQGITMSSVIKIFMMQCIEKKMFPF